MPARIEWSAFSVDPRVNGAAGVRASDADRDHALGFLVDAYADGRLDKVEHERRSQEALKSVYLGDLYPLLRDLDHTGSSAISPLPAGVRDQAVAKYRRERSESLRAFLGTSGITLVVWVGTAMASGGPYFFWPIFPIAATGLGWLMTVGSRKARIEKLEARYAKRELRRRRNQAKRIADDPG